MKLEDIFLTNKLSLEKEFKGKTGDEIIFYRHSNGELPFDEIRGIVLSYDKENKIVKIKRMIENSGEYEVEFSKWYSYRILKESQNL